LARDAEVREIGHDHHDAVDVLACEDLAIVARRELRLRPLADVDETRLPHVTDSRAVEVAKPLPTRLEAAAEEHVALHAAADETDPDAVVRAQHTRGRGGRRLRGRLAGAAGKRRRRHAGDGLAEKITATWRRGGGVMRAHGQPFLGSGCRPKSTTGGPCSLRETIAGGILAVDKQARPGRL